MPLCGLHLATDPSTVSPVSVADFSATQDRANPLLECVSNPMPWAAFVMSHGVLSEAVSISSNTRV